MKKFLLACGLALTLTALSHQPASAWHKFNFSVGMNVSWEAANNSYLCGAFTSGPGPGWGYGAGYAPPAYGFDGYAAAPAPVAGPAAPPVVAQPAAQGPVRQAHYTWGQAGYAQPTYYPPTYYGSAPSYWYGY